MCLLFLYLNNEEDNGKYRVILANNRDEFWVRPTAQAEFRGSHPRWIGGADLEPGREGGTWMGVSTSGKLGVLLNVLTPQELDKKGRGTLVTDFLTGNQTCDPYIDTLFPQATQYNPFHLLLLDLSDTGKLHYLNNSRETGAHSETFPSGIYGFDNSTDIARPWKKMSEGQKIFTEVVTEHGQPENRDTVVDKLIDLLNDKTSHFPDEQMQKQFSDVGFDITGELIKQRSCMRVFSPSMKYGTRTNTVLLIDKEGNCDYVERTLETPVNEEDPKWQTLQYNFALDDLSPDSKYTKRPL